MKGSGHSERHLGSARDEAGPEFGPAPIVLKGYRAPRPPPDPSCAPGALGNAHLDTTADLTRCFGLAAADDVAVAAPIAVTLVCPRKDGLATRLPVQGES